MIRIILLSLSALMVAGLLYKSASPALKALEASWKLSDYVSSKEGQTFAKQGQLRRLIQKHYLKFDVYLPLEDIVTLKGSPIPERYQRFMEKACGNAQVYIIIPLRLDLPVIGEQVYEWCWKPKVLS